MDLWVDRGIDTWVVSAWSEREHIRDLLVAIGDLESFVKADDRRGGYARHGGYDDGSQEPPTPVEAELSQISYQSDLYQSDLSVRLRYQSDFGINRVTGSALNLLTTSDLGEHLTWLLALGQGASWPCASARSGLQEVVTY